jgi:hypothetical protein
MKILISKRQGILSLAKGMPASQEESSSMELARNEILFS